QCRWPLWGFLRLPTDRPHRSSRAHHRRDRRWALIAWIAVSVEPNGGVKGGSAAAQRAPLTPPLGSNTPVRAIKAQTDQLSKCVRDVSEHLSGMSPGYTSSRAMTLILKQLFFVTSLSDSLVSGRALPAVSILA